MVSYLYYNALSLKSEYHPDVKFSNNSLDLYSFQNSMFQASRIHHCYYAIYRNLLQRKFFQETLQNHSDIPPIAVDDQEKYDQCIALIY